MQSPLSLLDIFSADYFFPSSKKDEPKAAIVSESLEVEIDPDAPIMAELVEEVEDGCDKAPATFSPTYSAPYYWQQDDSYLQLSHMTKLNRFPKIFESAKKLQPNPKRILSFGCSTGEECVTLSELFPDAEIVGIDIDFHSIRYARRTVKSDRIHFHTDLGATGQYDLALCLMVFFSLDQPVPFERMSANLKKIDRHLNQDALLMIYTSDHDPVLVEEISKYEPVNVWKHQHNKNQKEYFDGYYRKK